MSQVPLFKPGRRRPRRRAGRRRATNRAYGASPSHSSFVLARCSTPTVSHSAASCHPDREASQQGDVRITPSRLPTAAGAQKRPPAPASLPAARRCSSDASIRALRAPSENGPAEDRTPNPLIKSAPETPATVGYDQLSTEDRSIQRRASIARGMGGQGWSGDRVVTTPIRFYDTTTTCMMAPPKALKLPVMAAPVKAEVVARLVDRQVLGASHDGARPAASKPSGQHQTK